MNASKKTEKTTRLPYEAPTLTVMGKVEHLTALLVRGVPDLVSHGNIL